MSESAKRSQGRFKSVERGQPRITLDCTHWQRDAVRPRSKGHLVNVPGVVRTLPSDSTPNSMADVAKKTSTTRNPAQIDALESLTLLILHQHAARVFGTIKNRCRASTDDDQRDIFNESVVSLIQFLRKRLNKKTIPYHEVVKYWYATAIYLSIKAGKRGATRLRRKDADVGLSSDPAWPGVSQDSLVSSELIELLDSFERRLPYKQAQAFRLYRSLVAESGPRDLYRRIAEHMSRESGKTMSWQAVRRTLNRVLLQARQFLTHSGFSPDQDSTGNIDEIYS